MRDTDLAREARDDLVLTMTDPPAGGASFVQTERAPAAPPPAATRGVLGWARANLVSTPLSGLLTVVAAGLVGWAALTLVRYLLVEAVWTGADGTGCRSHPDGACWAFVRAKFDYFRYGSYPLAQRWRVDTVELVGAVLIGWLLWTGAPRRGLAAGLFFVAYPVFAFVLMRGVPALGLPSIDTSLWGGLFVTLLMSVVGIVASLPLGVLLALGRRSRLPIVRAACTVFIEVVRGVPFITVLFMANFMLPLFVPDWLSPDRLLRPLLGTVIFASAYMAEVVRGGLQALPKGQAEGATAMGLSTSQGLRLVILPQALAIVIPGIVSTFIGLFKDTTLVAVVGIFDFLRTVEAARLDPNWAGLTISTTSYAFAALVFWVFCFGMSRYSQYTERRLNAGRRH